jgi:fructose-bisphosphate aldolase class II
MLLPLIKQADVPVVLHLDHCTNPDMADACMAVGWDSVMIDASHFPLAENIRITAKVVSRAHALGIDVEGELGTIEGVEEDISHSHSVHASYTDSLTFVSETGIDAFAPAIGTAHGVYKGEPHIEFSLVEQLANAVSCPIVIHGGTGLSEDTFCRLIKNGAAKINVSTALKHAYVEGIAQYLSDNPGKTDPLALDEAAFFSVKETVRRHIRLFGKE